MTKSRRIGPQDVLCTIFTYTRDVGPVEMRTLRKTLRIDPTTLETHLAVLRRRGLIADHKPRLTFLGLAAAARLVPTFVSDSPRVKRRADEHAA